MASKARAANKNRSLVSSSSKSRDRGASRATRSPDSRSSRSNSDQDVSEPRRYAAALSYREGYSGAMSRYKGRISARAIERDFPHVVETVVPKGGLDKTLDAMHAFHKRHRIEAHTGKGRRNKNGRDYIRWCFANPEIAAKFAGQFVRG